MLLAMGRYKNRDKGGAHVKEGNAWATSGEFLAQHNCDLESCQTAE